MGVAMVGDAGSGNLLRLGSEAELSFDEANPLSAVDRRRLEAWLAALLQTEHLALLVGNGLSSAVGHMTGTPPPHMWTHLSPPPKTALEKVRAHADKTAAGMGRVANLEDEIRAAMTLAEGFEVVGNEKSAKELRHAITVAMTDLLQGVLNFEKGIWTEHLAASDKAKEVTDVLLKFLGPFVSRPVQRDRLHLFTTNYDRLLEYAADVLGLRLIDRFEGHLHPRFTASRLNLDVHYSPPGVRGEPRLVEGVVRYSKLHGSVDWQFHGREILRSSVPFGGPFLSQGVSDGADGGDSRTAVIYPNPAKDVETLAYPYAELFRDLAAAICRPNTTLVTFGYGFGDGHINRVIADMLRIPSTHLIVISRDPLPTLDDFKKRNLYPRGQTTELIGPALGSLKEFADLLPSLTPGHVLDAQFDYLDRRKRLDSTFEPSTVDQQQAAGTN